MKNTETTDENEDNLSVRNKEEIKGQVDVSDDDQKQSSLCPTAFYCPITKELFEHPVVAPDGDSYELFAVEERYEPACLYENRALLEVIKEVKKTKTSDTGNFEASLQNIQQNIKTNLSNLVDGSAFTLNWLGPLPDAYYCPITLDLMHHPVIDAEGTTYDRRAIVKWLRANGKSPFTRKDLKAENLYPNNVIRDLIHNELDKSDESIHPSIRKWKTQKQEQEASGSDHENWDDDDQNYEEEDDDDDSLPVTEDQIHERRSEERRRRRQHVHTRVACCLILLVLFYFVPYVFFMFSFFFSLCCIIHCKRNRYNR